MTVIGTYDGLDLGIVTVEARLIIEPAQSIGRGLTIEHEPIPDTALDLSISGESHYRGRNGRQIELGAGQNIDDARKANPRIAELWERWHLNGMRPGCAHQGETWLCTNPTEASEVARRIGSEPESIPCGTLNGWPVIREKFGEHPYPRTGDECYACGRSRWDEPSDHCPVSGYRFGTAWLFEPVPDEVLAELRRLFGKPEGWQLPRNRFARESAT